MREEPAYFAGDDLLILNDRDFVIALWHRARAHT